MSEILAQEIPSEILEEYAKRFKAAWKEHAKNGQQSLETSSVHQAAVTYARDHDLPIGVVLVEATLAYRQNRCAEGLAKLEPYLAACPPRLAGYAAQLKGAILVGLKRIDDAIECLEKALLAPNYDTPGITLNGLGWIYANQGDYERAIAYYEKALVALNYDTPGNTFNNLGLTYAEKGDYERAIAYYEKALAAPNYDTPGKVYNNLGLAYAEKGDYDRAVLNYEKALVAPNYDTPGNALNNLGLAYAEKGDYAQAISYFEKALATPNYDTPGKAFNNLGLVYANKGDYDQAISYFEKALATPNYDTPGKVYNNLGLAYAEKSNNEQAIFYYKKALAVANYGTPKITLNNLAFSLWKSGKFAEALKKIDEVLQKTGENSEDERAKGIRSLILADRAKIKPSPEDEALVVASPSKASDGDTPESRIVEKLRGREDKYEQYLKRSDSPPNKDSAFHVLRGWSSAVTLLEGGSEHQWRGGGYFLKWQGRGVVIDPGFDFLDNFHDAGFHGREIDAVLVSHNHPDHNYDLESLDDLRYEIFRRSLGKTNAKPGVPGKLPKTTFVLDKDTAENFSESNLDHRGTPLQFSYSDYEEERWLSRIRKLPFTIKHFPVQHGKDVPHAVGFKLVLHGGEGVDDFVIGYTGDTTYFEAKDGKPGLADHLRDCDILLAHISQPDNQEFTKLDYLKPVHLGYNGLIRLIKETKPKLTLVGEFWAGLADLRLDLIQGLRLRSGTPAILPVGLGFQVRLPSMEVECTRCQASVSFSQIKVAPPTTAFGPLGYLCPRCLL